MQFDQALYCWLFDVIFCRKGVLSAIDVSNSMCNMSIKINSVSVGRAMVFLKFIKLIIFSSSVSRKKSSCCDR